MGWIQTVRKVVNKRKVKLFSLFLFCSLLAWFISNLSESYINETTVNLRFVNTPENSMLVKASKDKIKVKIEAVGFQLLGFNFATKNIDIDIADLTKKKGRSFITHLVYQQQIEGQLSSTMRLVEIEKDTLFFEFKEIGSKEIPVRPMIKMNMAQNYFIEGPLKIEPASITITGPKDQLDTITTLTTTALVLTDLDADFTRALTIVQPQSLENMSFSEKTVTVKGMVSRFSENVIEVPVQVINLPKKVGIKTVPESVPVLCKAKIKDLKNLKSDDFKVVTDYLSIARGSGRLTLQLVEIPSNVYSATLIETQVTYILEKQ